jgi:trans-aconitate methyltransferase
MTAKYSIREWVKRYFPILHSGWRFALASVEVVLDPWASGAAFDRCFAKQSDPWEFWRPREQDRMNSALHMLDGVGGRFEHAFEIGCAEGMFTQRLKEHCASLLAADISTLALQRAEELCRGGVQFRIWDLRQDAVPGEFDLVVAMCVLECLRRRRDFRTARAKLVAAMRPGGYLLVSHCRQSQLTENSLWGRWLLRDGKWINEFLGQSPELEPVVTEVGDHYVNCLFRKRPSS